MTTTYDPAHPSYYDESDLRKEMTRVYDICNSCRLCHNLCSAFPSLFSLLDAHDDAHDASASGHAASEHGGSGTAASEPAGLEGHAGALTAAEQDRVVDECFQCKMCYVKCPYVPPHEWELDFPRLMMRAQAQRVRSGRATPRERLTSRVLASTDLNGQVGSALAPLLNPAMRPGSPLRAVVQAATGIASQRLLPPYSRERFSSWWKRREASVPPEPADSKAEVAVFPTCLVEYMEPAVGKDLVAVYERNGIRCSLPGGARCCGAPWLHSGEVERFVAQARRNVGILIGEVRAGRDVVVSQPTCAYVLKRDYPIYVGTVDAAKLAERTFDASEYLMKQHRENGGIDVAFSGSVPESVTFHAACHMRAQNVGLKGRDLIRLTGAKVTVVDKCSGIDGTWGYRAENYDLSKKVAQPMARAIAKVHSEQIAGECHLANGSIEQETGIRPSHPVQVLARAYGIASSSEHRRGVPR